MNTIKAKDLIDGDNSEIVCKGLLELYFDTVLTKLAKFHPMDFIDISGIYYEVKGRNNKYSKYPTTMIGHNKLLFQHKLDKPVRFIFKFTDGVYYYEYDKSKLDDIIICTGGRKDRGCIEMKKYAYIDIKFLTKI